jgi:hypothetical protein
MNSFLLELISRETVPVSDGERLDRHPAREELLFESEELSAVPHGALREDENLRPGLGGRHSHLQHGCIQTIQCLL